VTRFDHWAGPGRYATVLDELEVRMRLGIHAEEVARPQRVLIGGGVITARPDLFPRMRRLLAESLNGYLDVHEVIARRDFRLQEALCEAIAALCFADRRVRGVRVRTMKPDIYPDAVVGCEIIRENPAR